MMVRYSEIIGCGRFLPDERIDNASLSEICNTDDAWIRARTGISERRYADVALGTSDLAVEAGKRALCNSGMSPRDLDLIIAATQTPDFYWPGIGVQIQAKLGCRAIPALDVRGQCSGFTWALSSADAFVRSGMYRNVLIVGAEVQSRFLDYSDKGRSLAVLLADGGGAVVLTAKEGQSSVLQTRTPSAVYGHELGSDGSGYDALIMRRPGSSAFNKQFATANDGTIRNKDFHAEFDGARVFRSAIEQMSHCVESLLQSHGVTVADLDALIPHQANTRILECVGKRIGIARNKVFSNIDKYGNTGSASIPIALAEAFETGFIKKGDLIATVAFGAGFTWGANLIRL